MGKLDSLKQNIPLITLSLVAELQEEVEKSLRQRERETDRWSYSLPILRESQQESEEPHSSCHVAEGGDLLDRGGCK